ncbi:uncharacterized protein LOC129894689 [Solanum dulcamara]|uniref:uncharacterized protein LOC129894689 n=1 Tax=Solanum dulcamara TaxID=45834 RepID=UPI0024851579|nr:uncharacterized protein LOC129894689 [Solanum dulcamara]
MVDPQKIEVVKNWARPSSVSEVRSFMGLANYYRWFMRNFAFITTHLTRLTQKEAAFEWTDNCEESFQKLKTLLTTTPILTLPVEGKDFIVYCDTSHSGLGVVMMQDENIIAYALWQLKGIFIRLRQTSLRGEIIVQVQGMMHLHRVYVRRNANMNEKKKAPQAPNDPLTKQVSHAKFRLAFQVLAQAVVAQSNSEVVAIINPNMSTMASRVCDFTRMNPTEFHCSKMDKDP